jgi:hypothetical protein
MMECFRKRHGENLDMENVCESRRMDENSDSVERAQGKRNGAASLSNHKSSTIARSLGIMGQASYLMERNYYFSMTGSQKIRRFKYRQD